MGRRKISIEPILNPTRRRATFEKRRVGLLKKAMELSILTDSTISITIYRPCKNELQVYSSIPFDDVISNYQNYVGTYTLYTNDHIRGMIPGKANNCGYAIKKDDNRMFMNCMESSNANVGNNDDENNGDVNNNDDPPQNSSDHSTSHSSSSATNTNSTNIHYNKSMASKIISANEAIAKANNIKKRKKKSETASNMKRNRSYINHRDSYNVHSHRSSLMPTIITSQPMNYNNIYSNSQTLSGDHCPSLSMSPPYSSFAYRPSHGKNITESASTDMSLYHNSSITNSNEFYTDFGLGLNMNPSAMPMIANNNMRMPLANNFNHTLSEFNTYMSNMCYGGMNNIYSQQSIAMMSEQQQPTAGTSNVNDDNFSPKIEPQQSSIIESNMMPAPTQQPWIYQQPPSKRFKNNS